MKNTKVAIEVEITNIKKIAELKQELKELRKQQRDSEKGAREGEKISKTSAKGYKDNAKAIKEKSKELRTLNKNMGATTAATKKATKSSNSLSKSFVKAAAAMGIIVGAFRTISRAVSSVVSTFTEFEFVMAKVNAVSGATQSEFTELTASAEELGRSTFFTATQVGELQLAYSKLGFTAQEVLDATEATLNLATATGTDLARAAQVAGASIRGFQLDATEAGRVVDVMAVAFSSSALDIEKWNTSMTKVAPIAAMAGFTIEETAAIMGKLSDTGIEASIAGTSLRNIFLKMQDPSSDLTKTVGHTITNLDEMLMSFKKLQDEGTDLADVLHFMDVRQVAAFGTMLKGSDDIQELRQALLEATGEGERMSDMVGDTLQGAFLKLKSATQGVSIFLMKTFGKSLQGTIERMAEWLNNLVKTEGKIVKLWNQIKIGVKLLASYVIGAKLTVMWNNFMASSFMAAAQGATATSTAVGILRGALALLKTAIISTGIGMLVILLGEWVGGMMAVNDEMKGLLDVEGQVNSKMVESQTEIKKVELSLKSLVSTREMYNKLLDKEGKLLNDNKVSQQEYARLKKKEKQEIKTLNSFYDKYNKEQIKVNDSTKDIIKNTKELTQVMKDHALAGVYRELEAQILKSQVSSNLVYKEFMNQMDSLGRKSTKVLGVAMNDIGQYINRNVHGAEKAIERMNNAGILEKLLEQHNITKTQFKEVISIRFGWDNEFNDGLKGGVDGYYEKKVADLRTEIQSMTGTAFDDLFDELDLVEDKTSGMQDAAWGVNEKIAKRVETLNLKKIDNEEEYQRQLLQAQINGVNDYLAQENNKEEGITAAKIKLNKLERKQRILNNKENLQDLKNVAIEEIIIEKQKLKDKEITQHEFKKNVANIQKTLLEGEYKLLDETQKVGKEGLAIKQKLADLELQMQKDDIAESERLLKQEYDNDVLALEKYAADTLMSQANLDNLLLQLELEFLTKKRDLHAGNALELIDIQNSILNNSIQSNKTQMQMIDEQVSALGGVGSALTSLAGDNEKLNAIKEAGNKINMVANTIQALMTLQTNLQTIAEGKLALANIFTTKTEIAKGAAKQSSLMFPLNLIAVVATLALIGKVMGVFEKGGIIEEGKKFKKGGFLQEFADGGMVQGKSHAQGGEKFAVGGRVVELEGGEAVINKRSTAMYRNQLSEINQAGGGVKFADGGLLNNPSFAQQQFSSGIGAQGGAQKVYVVESEITQSQKTVNVLEANATI
jgi:TP901 family phage tail tape measure protein